MLWDRLAPTKPRDLGATYLGESFPGQHYTEESFHADMEYILWELSERLEVHPTSPRCWGYESSQDFYQARFGENPAFVLR
jgi:hypothetical protein